MMRITRAEARLIAEELAKILYPQQEELLTIEEVAKLLKVSRAFINQHLDEFPSVKIGGARRFPKHKIMQVVLQ